MQIVIPMAGSGARFLRRGYRAIKPLIEVDGRPMIEHVVRMFPGEDNFVFICSRPHLRETDLERVLRSLAPGCRIVAVEPHKLGPVHSTIAALEAIDESEPVIVNYCDFSVDWDYGRFKRTVEELGCAGCLTAYRGFHPHSLGTTLYGYLREKDGYLLEIREKAHFTPDRMSEYASTGTYYLRRGSLVRRYFPMAVERGLQVRGEFYASLPFNLMVADGLPVYVYEVERFLQWGTPEDLEEYVKWSSYFGRYAGFKPGAPATADVNLVPMAGEGARFARAGYTQPKPLVPVAGRPLAARALETLPASGRSIVVARREHLADGALGEVLEKGQGALTLLTVSGPTAGQVATCALARQSIAPEESLLIAPCDAVLVYDEDRLAALLHEEGVDCVVWTFRNHTHANRNPHQYGWVDVAPSGEVRGVQCKVPLGEDVSRDPGIVGVFWFRHARLFFAAGDALIAADRRVNGEFYVDAAIQVLLEQGGRARIFDVTHYVGLGTPDDVRTFEYWEGHFAGRPDHPYRRSG